MRPYRFVLLALILVSSTVFVVGQTAPHDESRTSWTFDTYTPGPCSATGARHGGCPPGDLIRIAVTTVASGLVQPWHQTFLPGTNDLLVTELRPGGARRTVASIDRNGTVTPLPNLPSEIYRQVRVSPD